MPATSSNRLIRHSVQLGTILCLAVCCFFSMSVGHAEASLRAGVDGKPSLTGKSVDTRQICFTENRGQIVDTDGNHRPDIRYTADVSGVRLYVLSTGISYVFTRRKDEENRTESMDYDAAFAEAEQEVVLYRMDMHFDGGNPFARVRPGRVLDGVSHYYLPHCPDGIRNVRSYEGVLLEDIYPSIDMGIKTVNGRLKSEFVVRPGGDPSDIRMRYTGATALFAMPDGAMQVHGPLGYVEESRPVSWQDDGLQIGTSFRIDESVVRWEVDSYDTRQTLILDPWAAIQGGSAWDGFRTLDCDAAGNIYAGGQSESSNFPVQSGVQTTKAGGFDIVVVKYTASGQLAWSTYYGGSASDAASELCTDTSGDIVIAGRTNSSDFPVVNAWQSSLAGDRDLFLMKVSSSGIPIWVTYFGGSQVDMVYFEQCGLATGPGGEIYLCSGTASTDLPVFGGQQMTHAGGNDVFLAKFHPSGSLNWATFLGGSGDDRGTACTLTGDGTIAIAGISDGVYPLLNPMYSSLTGSSDIVVSEFDTAGIMLWSTYLTGSADVNLNLRPRIACNASGDLYLLTGTANQNLPTINPVQVGHAGNLDRYLCRLVKNGGPVNSRIMDWATYYGGSDNDGSGGDISIDQQGNIVCGGYSMSTDYPLVNALQTSRKGSWDMVITVFNAAHAPVFSTYLGGNLLEEAFDVQYSSSGEILLSGGISSSDFPIPRTYEQAGGNMSYDGIICNVGAGGALPPEPPTDLTAGALSPTRVQLYWEDNADNENNYEIEHKSPATSWTLFETVAANTESQIAVDLEPDTEHSFRVRAVNAKYESDWSNTATATTGSFDPPINLSAIAHSSEAVTLQWEDKTVGEDGYHLEYRIAGMGWADGGEAAADVESAAIDGLDANTAYEFRIRAYAGNVMTAYSDIAQATTLLYLGSPANLDGALLSETQVSLSWEDRADGEAGYEIEHNADGKGWTLLHTTAVNAESYDVQGLTPNTTNDFRVRAVGPNAASGYSNTYSVLTRMQPAVPLNLLATAVDHASIRVTWQRGSENEDGYELERRADGSSWTLLQTAGPGDGDVRDENLMPSTTYWYRVRAYNDLGRSDWSTEASATTMNIPVPDTPFGVRANATGPHSINLQWVMPSPCTAETIEIEQSLTGDPGSYSGISANISGDDRSHEVAGLDADTEYFFRIRAVNASGPSTWSDAASARTAGAGYPSTPRDFIARVQPELKIGLGWDMPAQSNEDGFTLERSLTGDAGDFTELLPAPAQGTRSYVDSGLTVSTTYYYRLRANNAQGSSAWTPVVSATTITDIITPELRAAMDAKRQVIGQLETLIPEGDAQMSALRTLFGDHARGYDESAAADLIDEWSSTGSSNPPLAVEAMQRFVLFEEALRDSWGDGTALPPVPGALDLATQCARIPAIATKDLIALTLAWKDERAYLTAEDPVVDAAMEDMIFALSDDMRQLLALMGADRGSELADLTQSIVRGRGEVDDLAPGLMLSLLDYWPQHMLGRYYIPATQSLINVFADRTAQYDYVGTTSAAAQKRDAYLAALRSDVDGFSAGFSDYYRIGTSLDAAYSIGQTPGADADVFLLRLRVLRPRLTGNMYEALAGAAIPTERFLYLTAANVLPGVGSVPAALAAAGDAIFDPTQGGIVQHDDPLAVFQKRTAPAANSVIDADFTLLQEMRTKVEEGNTDHVSENFAELRVSGTNMTAEIDRMMRPLLGVDRARLFEDATLRDDYYAALARMQQLKTRRTVLSVAMADYMRTPSAQKQADLMAEIDSIIGPFSNAQDALTDVLTDAAGVILLPALLLDNADIVRDEESGAMHYRLRFAVKNVGGAEATTPAVKVAFLSSGATAVGAPEFGFTTLRPDVATGDSLEMTVDEGVTSVTVSLTMESGGRVFVDRHTLPVPQSTTGVDADRVLPATCLLHQNYPNPFNPATMIRFALSSPMDISLVVTDALGREVARLAEHAPMRAGTHSLQFTADGLISGVYFYRLETADAVLVKKMVVMK